MPLPESQTPDFYAATSPGYVVDAVASGINAE